MKRRSFAIMTMMIGLWFVSGSIAQDGVQISTPIFQGLDNNGDPCSGCKLYVFVSGTQTPTQTYSNRGRTAQNQNPVILDAAGRARVFVGATGLYDFRLDSASDVTVWTIAGVGMPDQSAAGLTSTGGIDIELDTDNNTSNAAFRILSGTGSAVFSVTEAGIFSPAALSTINDGDVTTTKLADAAVTQPKLGARAVGPDELALLAVGPTHMQTSSVGTSQVTNGSLIVEDFGCSGTPTVDTFLRGDCAWAAPPAQYAAAFSAGSSTTSSTTYVNVGPSISLDVLSGDTVNIYIFGTLRSTLEYSYGCNAQLLNVTTGTILSTTISRNSVATAVRVTDSVPALGANVYRMQIRGVVNSNPGSAAPCAWSAELTNVNPQANYLTRVRGSRGLIAFRS